MRQDSVFPEGRCHYIPHFTTSALTLRSEETALRVRLCRLPRCCGQGGTAGRGAALHEVEFPIKRKPGQTCASLRPGRLPYNDHPRTPAYSPGCRRRPAFHKLKRPYAACGHVRLRRTAPPALQAKREETEPVMEEFNCGEKGKSSSSPRVSRKFNLAFHPLVERFPLPLFECRETISFATLV